MRYNKTTQATQLAPKTQRNWAKPQKDFKMTNEQATLKAAAAAKGLEVFFMANIGYLRGSSYDEVAKVCGNTYPIKDTLKQHGARWLGAEKCWVLHTADFTAALAAI